ncbi:MAG: putative ATPase [Paracoccaceae bacterium]|jgi:putative ATPase
MADLFQGMTPAAPPVGADPVDPKAEGLRPLADRLRPAQLSDVVGQDGVLGPGAPLAEMIAAGRMSSLILWGPPGVGKTTIARLLAHEGGLSFVQISAIFTGVADLRKVFEAAKLRRSQGRATLLFVDEIHRFNKAQQDGFLPHMEDGTIILVGATTENPSFELNAALLSRAQVMVLIRLTETAMSQVLERAEALLGSPLKLTPDAREALIAMADGDGRALLNMAEEVSRHPGAPLDRAGLSRRVSRRAAQYDKGGDGHYGLISALHKSVRSSDADASLYWLARMLKGGEDPRYLARRLTRMAIEDIGLAEPQVHRQCLDAWETYERLGSPEGELALAQAVVALALAPKSNAAYVGWKAAMRAAEDTGSLPPPKSILNAPTKMMKEQGFGAGYLYDHDAEDGFSGQNCWPDGMARQRFYVPVERGHERDLAKRVAWFDKKRNERGEG